MYSSTLWMNLCFFAKVIISYSISPYVREKQRNPKVFYCFLEICRESYAFEHFVIKQIVCNTNVFIILWKAFLVSFVLIFPLCLFCLFIYFCLDRILLYNSGILELTMYHRLASNSHQSFCLRFLSAKAISLRHHTLPFPPCLIVLLMIFWLSRNP